MKDRALELSALFERHQTEITLGLIVFFGIITLVAVSLFFTAKSSSSEEADRML